jgi:hypothetical protein
LASRRSIATSISSFRTFITVYQYAAPQNVNSAPAIAAFPVARAACRSLNAITIVRRATIDLRASRVPHCRAIGAAALRDANARARATPQRRRATYARRERARTRWHEIVWCVGDAFARLENVARGLDAR